MSLSPLTLAAQRLRTAAIAADDAGHELWEIAFRKWAAETVFPQGVDRWLAAVAEASK